jgi:hypothetical protein
MESVGRVVRPCCNALVLAVAGLVVAAPAAFAAKTDVRATSLKAPRTTLTVLGGGVAGFAVRNGSRVKASRLAVTIVLSKDRKKDARDAIAGGATLPALRARAKRTLQVALLVPGKVKPGAYWLVACVTAGKQAQSSKKNDCTVAKAKVTVRAVLPAVVPKITALDPLGTTKVIGAAGGTITAPGALGGSVTLTVPAKALSMATSIRIVPVASVAPGPRGLTPLLSVIVQPEGLLAPGATIKFAPPAVLSSKKLAGFAFGGEDESIVRAPLVPGKGLTLDAALFGGYGLGVPTTAKSLPSRLAAACSAESLRKRADEIAASYSTTDMTQLISASEALLRFEASTVIPAMKAAVAAGASAEDLSPFISLALSIERQAALLGIESPVSILTEVANALKKAGRNDIKKCAERSEGPLKTQTEVLRISRAIALLGGGDSGLEAPLESDCLSKPYLLTYQMTTDEQWMTTDKPPAFKSGSVLITDLAVPVPKIGAPAEIGSGPMTTSSLTCDPGTAPGYIACAVTSAMVDLDAQVIRSETSTKSEQRCGRTVQVPVYKVVIQLRHPVDTQHFDLTVQPPMGSIFHVGGDSGSSFDRALSVATDGELQQVTLPDSGGSELLIGSSAGFHGLPMAIDSTGNATLKLK